MYPFSLRVRPPSWPRPRGSAGTSAYSSPWQPLVPPHRAPPRPIKQSSHILTRNRKLVHMYMLIDCTHCGRRNIGVKELRYNWQEQTFRSCLQDYPWYVYNNKFYGKNDEILLSLIVFTVKILNPAPKNLVPLVNITSTYEWMYYIRSYPADGLCCRPPIPPLRGPWLLL